MERGRAIEAAAAVLDVPARDLTVVREGAAVLVRCDDRLVRVEDLAHEPTARRQVQAAQVLAAAGVPAVRLAGPSDQPVHVGGAVVTVWGWVEVTGGHVDDASLGRLARTLHERTRRSAPSPPGLDPFAAIAGQLDDAARAGATPPDELAFLADRLDACRQRWGSVTDDPLPPALVHGDLHDANVLVTTDGLLLADLELAGWGPPTYDLAARLVGAERYGQPLERYERFSAAYGFDLRDWAGAGVRTDTYALWTTAWAVAHRHRSPALAAEAALRVAWWRGGGRPGPAWTVR